MVGPASSSLRKRALEAARVLLDRTGQRPRVAMLLGTGHSAMAQRIKGAHTISTGDLPGGMTLAHGSPLVSGQIHGVHVVLSDAPLSCFEGYSPLEVTFPVRVLRAMGADVLILTAGVASLSRQLEPGAIAVIEDHINLSGIHPLQGPPDESLGPRFLDMTDPYPNRLRTLARAVARQHGIPCLEAVLVAMPGPSLPTRAECRFLQRIGADLVGMSLVPEVLAARHSGFEVLALAGITQRIQLESPRPTPIEEMLDAVDLAEPRMTTVLDGVLASFGDGSG
jgi:purine-nucleoside phosphorylase